MPAIYGLPSPPPFTPYLLDVARAGVATADTVYSTFVAANAIDGDAVSRWNSLNPATNRWLQIDLATATTISAYRVMSLYNDWVLSGFPWRIESSPDAATWTTQYSSAVAPKLDSGVVGLGASATARYWRLYVTGTGANVGIPIVTFSLFRATARLHS